MNSHEHLILGGQAALDPRPLPQHRRTDASDALRIERQQALIVDGCRFIATRMARVLESKGCASTVVAHGYRGLELVRARALV